MTVLLSSHLLAEVEELCNRVAIVRSGRIVYEGALAELRAQAGDGYRLRTTDDEPRAAVCRAQPGIGNVRAASARRLACTADEDAVGELSLALVEAGALDPRAGPQPGDARGPLLLAHRGRRSAAAPPRRRPARGGGAA